MLEILVPSQLDAVFDIVVFGVQTVAMFDMISLHTSLLLISVLSQSFFNLFLNPLISSHKEKYLSRNFKCTELTVILFLDYSYSCDSLNLSMLVSHYCFDQSRKKALLTFA